MKIRDIITCSFESLVSRKLSNLFIMLIISISGILLYTSVIMYSNTRVNERNIKNAIKVDTKRLYSVNIQSGNIYNDDVANNSISFIKGIKKIDELEFSGGFFTSFLFFDELSSSNQYKSYNISKSDNEILIKYPAMSLIYYCDYELLNMYSIHYEIDNNYIPVIVGGGYKEIVEIGDTLTCDEKKYKIIGMLPQKTNAISETQGITYGDDNIISLDSYFIVPREYANYQTMCMNSIYYYIDNISHSEEVKSKVFAKAEENNLHVGIKKVSEIYNDLESEKSASDKNAGYYLMIIVFVCMISSITCNFVSLMYRKREYGILIANGVSLKEINYIILFENILKITVAMCLAHGYASKNYNILISSNNVYAKKETVISFVVTGIIILVVSTLGPMLMIHNSQPKDYIEEGI